MKSTIARLTVAIGTALMLTVGASALERPAGDVVLTVRGAITQKNAGEAAEFDPAMLRALSTRYMLCCAFAPFCTMTVYDFAGE